MPVFRQLLPNGTPLVYTNDPDYPWQDHEITIWQDDEDFDHRCSLECPMVTCDGCPSNTLDYDGLTCREYFLRQYPFRLNSTIYRRTT